MPDSIPGGESTRVREARPGDLCSLLRLYGLLEDPYPGVRTLEGEAAERRFEQVLADTNQKTLVAEVDGEVVGTLVVAIILNLAHGGDPYAVVENVAVDEPRRGEGIGKALMREAARLARDAGAYKLALSTNAVREKAHGFYRSVGLKETHVGFEVSP